MNKGRTAKASSIILSSTKRVPLQQRAQDRVNAILTAAESLLKEGENERLSIVDVAARAGITSTSIYHYFNSIEEVLAAIISRSMVDFQSELDAMVMQANTTEGLITVCAEGIRRGFKLYVDRPVARSLWISTRYLKILRNLDDDNNARTANLIVERFMHLASGVDRDSIYLTIALATTLAMPTYQLAALQPKRLQHKMVEEFAEMVKLRLATVVRK